MPSVMLLYKHLLNKCLLSYYSLKELLFPYNKVRLLKSDNEISVIHPIPLFCHGCQTSQN